MNEQNTQDTTSHTLIVWTLPNGREILSSGAFGTNAQDLAASIIAANIVPSGTPWRVVDETYTILPTVDELLAQFTGQIQDRLDAFAQTLTYDGILSACTYATSNVEMYRIEGQYCVEARDATWAKAYELLQAIQPKIEAGAAIPTWEEVEAQLPPLAWPEGSRGHIASEGNSA